MSNQELIQQTEDWVNKTHKHPRHLIRTGYWVNQLDPNASDELIVAAVSHDIERAFTRDRQPPADENNFEDEVYLIWHGKRSAEFVKQFLKDHHIDENFIDRVGHLVEVHEFGGNDEENVLKDADSISFLEINTDLFIENIGERWTKEDVISKINYMYKRISSQKARDLAQPFYEEAMRKLETLPS